MAPAQDLREARGHIATRVENRAARCVVMPWLPRSAPSNRERTGSAADRLVASHRADWRPTSPAGRVGGRAAARDVVAGRRSSDEARVALRSRARQPSPTVRRAPRRPLEGRTARRRRGIRSTRRRSPCLPRRCRRPACAATARRWSTNRAVPRRSVRRARKPLCPNNGRGSRSGCERLVAEQVRRSRPALARGAARRGSGSNVRGVGETQQDAGARRRAGLTSKVMNTGPSSDSASPEQPLARQNGVS